MSFVVSSGDVRIRKMLRLYECLCLSKKNASKVSPTFAIFSPVRDRFSRNSFRISNFPELPVTPWPAKPPPSCGEVVFIQRDIWCLRFHLNEMSNSLIVKYTKFLALENTEILEPFFISCLWRLVWLPFELVWVKLCLSVNGGLWTKISRLHLPGRVLTGS